MYAKRGQRKKEKTDRQILFKIFPVPVHLISCLQSTKNFVWMWPHGKKKVLTVSQYWKPHMKPNKAARNKWNSHAILLTLMF